jgi:glycosyltransferase involved in cell wall biosynthesis
MISHSDAILSISESIAKEVEKTYDLRLDKERLFVSHLGIPDWAIANIKTAEKNHTKILFVGRLEKRKGIDLLLAVIPNICARHPDVHFDIVGDDSIPSEHGVPYRHFFEMSAPQSAVAQVTFYGKVSESELQNHYKNCDIFVAPSRFESFGIIYLEAMACGKPVVGSNAGGIPEVVAHGVNGLLPDPGRADLIEYAIEQLILDASMRSKFGLSGRERYEKLFTATEMAQNSLCIYRQLADAPTEVANSTAL